MNALDLGVIAVAAWRLALFLVDDVGPFDAADRFRRLIRADPEARRLSLEAKFKQSEEARKVAAALGREPEPVAMLRNAGDSISWDGDQYVVSVQPTDWEKLWSCMRCMSAWTALLLAGVWQLETWPVQLLAIWGLAQMVENARQMRL